MNYMRLFGRLLLVIMMALCSSCSRLKSPTEPSQSAIMGENDEALLAAVKLNPVMHGKKIDFAKGGKLTVSKLVELQVLPYSMSTREETEVFGYIDRPDEETMILRFEPSDLTFDPKALLTLYWGELGDHKTRLKVTLFELIDPATQEFVEISNWNDLGDSYEWDESKKNHENVNFRISHFSTYKITIKQYTDTGTRSHWRARSTFNWKNGGVLKIDDLFKLKIYPESMSFTGDVEFISDVQGMEDGSLVFYFGPDGIQFNPKAELELRWDKLRKLGYDAPINFYCYNPETGVWDLISKYDEQNELVYKPKNDKKDKVGDVVEIIDEKWDKLSKTIRFRIPHFSIWAISQD